MLQAVWTVGIVLAVIAATDRRARPMLALIALVLVQTALCEQMVSDRLTEVAMRIPVDLAGGLLSLNLIRRERWSLMIPAMFCAFLFCHAAFWLARFNGVDIWGIYPHALNALFLLQLASLAWPGGGRLIGRLRDWSSRLVDGWRDRISPALERIFDTQADRHPDQAACPASHPARREPANRQADFVGVSSPAPVAR